MEKKKNYTPFDLEAAKAGRPVMTAGGRKVEIERFNLNNEDYPILGIVTREDGTDVSETYTLTGRKWKGGTDKTPGEDDLVMATMVYQERCFVNVFFNNRTKAIETSNSLFSSKGEAEEHGFDLMPYGLTYLDTVPVEIEWHEGE